MTGFKTFVFGLLVAISGPGLDYLGGFDWTKLGFAQWIVGLIGAGIIGLRALTSTSMFKSQ